MMMMMVMVMMMMMMMMMVVMMMIMLWNVVQLMKVTRVTQRGKVDRVDFLMKQS